MHKKWLCLGELWVDVEFEHAVDEHADVMADDFEEEFVDLCAVFLGADMGVEFSFHHGECGFI